MAYNLETALAIDQLLQQGIPLAVAFDQLGIPQDQRASYQLGEGTFVVPAVNEPFATNIPQPDPLAEAAAAFADEDAQAFAPNPVDDPGAAFADEDAQAFAFVPAPADDPLAEAAAAFADEDVQAFAPNPVDDPGAAFADEDAQAFGGQTAADIEDAEQGEAMRQSLRDQATAQQRAGQNYNGDWRVRISLAPQSNYLYNDSGNALLGPLRATQGVVFPYTPTIQTNYVAQYDTTDLTHSNYRGYFYKNSRVEQVSVNGTFTAQNTSEAQYLLAVIHFFRSVTKMFYGQDKERGTPPPMVYLHGFGEYQFANHPCLVSSFNYSLPNGVDYIRTQASNQNLQLDRQRAAASGSTFSQLFAGTGLDSISSRIGTLTNLLTGKPIDRGAAGSQGDLGLSVVNNTGLTTYVPTKMEIQITLLPLQTRKQVSQEFSLKAFANGSLLKGRGFW